MLKIGHQRYTRSSLSPPRKLMVGPWFKATTPPALRRRLAFANPESASFDAYPEDTSRSYIIWRIRASITSCYGRTSSAANLMDPYPAANRIYQTWANRSNTGPTLPLAGKRVYRMLCDLSALSLPLIGFPLQITSYGRPLRHQHPCRCQPYAGSNCPARKNGLSGLGAPL